MTEQKLFLGSITKQDTPAGRIYTYQGLICLNCNTTIGMGVAIVDHNTDFKCPGCKTVLK